MFRDCVISSSSRAACCKFGWMWPSACSWNSLLFSYCPSRDRCTPHHLTPPPHQPSSKTVVLSRVTLVNVCHVTLCPSRTLWQSIDLNSNGPYLATSCSAGKCPCNCPINPFVLPSTHYQHLAFSLLPASHHWYIASERRKTPTALFLSALKLLEETFAKTSETSS
jgi:hypothetical protein